MIQNLTADKSNKIIFAILPITLCNYNKDYFDRFHDTSNRSCNNIKLNYFQVGVAMILSHKWK